MSSNNPPTGNGTNANANVNANVNNNTTNTSNNNQNSRSTRSNRYNRDNTRNQTNNTFVPKLTTVESLTTNKEKRRQDFSKFQKSLHHHVMTTYSKSIDLSRAITHFEDPNTKIQSEIPTMADIRKKYNLYHIKGTESESPDDKEIREMTNMDNRDMLKVRYSHEIKNNADRVDVCKQNMAKLWTDIIGQCSPALQEELAGDPKYLQENVSFNSIWLMETLQRFTAGANKTTNKHNSLFKATKQFYLTQQGYQESLDEYYARFDSSRELVHLFNGEVIDTTSLTTIERTSNSAATNEQALQKYLAMCLLMNSNKSKYENLWNKLENDILVGQDSYPTSVGDTMHLLSNWKIDTPSSRNDRNGNNNDTSNEQNNNRRSGGVTFAQIPLPENGDFSQLPGFDSTRPTIVPARHPPHKITAHITCTRCNHPGHYASSCPFSLTGTPQLFQLPREPIVLSNTAYRTWFAPGSMIVDSGSTFNSIRDRFLLSNITACEPFESLSNGGGLTFNQSGTLTQLPELTGYHHPEGLTNILSLDLVQAKYHVTFDSSTSNTFTLHVSHKKHIVFQGFGSGLYFCSNTKSDQPYSVSLLNSVSENKSFYTKREVKAAEAARDLQGRVGWPSDQEYHEIIRDNLITNSAVTTDDLQRATHIFGGSATELLKGKSVYTPVNTKSTIAKIPLAPIILQTHPNDEIDIDFLYVQGAPYLLMKAKDIKFQAIQAFNRVSRKTKKHTVKITYKRGTQDIINGLEKVLRLFKKRGFTITLVNADNEFQKLEDKISAPVAICAAGQHVPRVERGIRFVKDRTRCYWIALPFKKVPKIMVDDCLTMVITCINNFPSKNGISTTLSPANIVLGRNKIDANNLTATFGRYYEVFCGTDNTNKERRISAICLRPSNEQGGYYFMNVNTGKRIHGYNFTELAMPNHIIDKVHSLADQEGAPDLDDDGCPIFEWELNHPIRDPQHNTNPTIAPTTDPDDDLSYDDESYNPDNDSDSDDDDDDNDLLSSDYVDEDTHNDDESISDDQDDAPVHQPTPGQEARSDVAPNHDDNTSTDTTSPQPKARSEQSTTNEPILVEDVNDDDDDDIIQHTDVEDEVSNEELQNAIDELQDEVEQELRSEIDASNIIQNEPRIRRKSKAPNITTFAGYRYNASMLQIGKDAFSKFEKIKANIFNNSVKTCFTQMSATKGIKLLGQKAIAAMFKEYKQLNDLTVLGRIDPKTLTAEQKRRALRAVNLIKLKRCGKVKGRTCADGSVQRKYVPREEASSPTLSLEAMMALLLINAFEARDTAVFDVPGAYLHADIPEDKFVLLKIENEFVDIMCEVNPEFLPDVVYENGKKVLYLQILKALYGMIESALLWYTLYTEVLQREGFKINPYDKCVANKTINGKQCTLAWYVDDNILSHIEPKVVDQVLAVIESYFPGLVVERGSQLNYLGMELDFFTPGKVKIGTVQYLKSMIEELEEELKEYNEDLDRKYSTPAARWIFKTDPEAKPLPEKKADIYRKFVAKLIWVEKRSRPDIEPTNSFLCTRVKAPDREDWHKFKRLMCFIKGTVDDVRIIGADDLLNMIVMIDSAHAVHENMRGHTGGITSFGTGVINQKSSKQRMNTRSSTETEHVGTSEYLPKPIFFELFMNAQGYHPKITLAKDNESEIRMLVNGKDSCTSNSKHVAIKYFWSTDRIKNGNIKVKYCNTNKMVADYMSKPLQGKAYKDFRSVIMGWTHMSTMFSPLDSVEERVEDSEKFSIITKGRKMTYAEALNCEAAVTKQNEIIGSNKELHQLSH